MNIRDYEDNPQLFLSEFIKTLENEENKVIKMYDHGKQEEKDKKIKELRESFMKILLKVSSHPKHNAYAKPIFTLSKYGETQMTLEDYENEVHSIKSWGYSYIYLTKFLGSKSFLYFLFDNSHKKEYKPLILRLHEYGYLSVYLLYGIAQNMIGPEFEFTFGKNEEIITASVYLYKYMQEHDKEYAAKTYPFITKYRFFRKGCIDEIVNNFPGITKKEVQEIIGKYLQNFEYPRYLWK